MNPFVRADDAPSAAPWLRTWAVQGFDHQSVRQVVRLGTGGNAVRFRRSNLYGTTPLRLSGAGTSRLRRDLNEWIRADDAVADFDRAADPEGTGAVPDGHHSGDHLHPGPLGYRVMADSIDLDSLR